MTTSIFCLEAGLCERFGGVPKSSLEVSPGVTLRQRLQQQFPEVRIITRKDVPNTTCTCATFLATVSHWKERVIILLGDVYYTDKCADMIRSEQSTLAFFSDLQDIFAISFTRLVMGNLLLIPGANHVCEDPTWNNGRLWELYRAVACLPKTATLPPQIAPFITYVNDETQDFDEPQEYADWKNGKSKNRLYRQLQQ